MLALEEITRSLDDAFVVPGLQMVIDGTDAHEIESRMLTKLEVIQAHHAECRSLFENIGKYAPAFGMIGTLVGLVIMLRNMNNPAAIGPGMAVALLTTLYGAVIANVMALPLADRLARWSHEEVLLKMIAIRGVIAIHAGENPSGLRHKLQGFLPGDLSTASEPAKQAA